MRKRSLSLLALTIALSVTPARAQPLAPPPPKEYQVQLRYRIPTARNERLVHFFALTRYLESIGFRKDAGPEAEPEDPTENRMTGTIVSANVAQLLRDRRIKSILLVPAGFKLPEEAEQPVKVQLTLASGLPLDRQRVLAQQVRDRLKEFGFREAIGYDHRGFTRLVGHIPAGELETLLSDLRGQPSGWLVPVAPIAELPLPFRNISPVVVTEVTPEPEGVPAAKEFSAPAEPVQGQEHLRKLTPDLRYLLAQEGEAAKPTRLEVILSRIPDLNDRGWQRALAVAVPGLVIEGRLGPLVTVKARAGDAAELAAVPVVSTVRLPRSGQPGLQPSALSTQHSALLEASGLARLHARGHRGKGVRVAVIDGDFRGFQRLLGKELPARTRMVDLTAERNYNLQPDPFPGDPQVLGHGSQCARAVALAAPEADMVLVRIDPAAPHQLEAVARSVNGETYRSESLARRSEELAADKERLRLRREELLLERRAILDRFGQDEESKKKRDAYFQKQADSERDELAYQGRVERYLQLLQNLRDLKGTPVVASSLVWNEGHPVDGSSTLSRYFDDRPFRAAFWLQSAGNTRGQVWADRFRDADDNGVMEFAPPDARLRPGRWTSELSFLAWQPFQGQPQLDLPAKATLRLSIQWREVHDPELQRTGEDLYREPLANLSLMVLRQRDPSGTKLPVDDLEVVARSVGLPQRLQQLLTSASYEQTVELTVDAPGRYAVRLEGRMPVGIRPASVPTLPALQKTWELRPRIFLNVLDGPSRQRGRAVFLDYVTDQGSIGMPGDARGVITVGSASLANSPQPSSALGPPLNLELLIKPDVLAYDGLHMAPVGTPTPPGTSLATSFAAGLTASALSAKMPRSHLPSLIRVRPGSILRVPEGWSAGR